MNIRNNINKFNVIDLLLSLLLLIIIKLLIICMFKHLGQSLLLDCTALSELLALLWLQKGNSGCCCPSDEPQRVKAE